MLIKTKLKNNIGNGIEIDFPSAGFIFGNGVKGVISGILAPNFVELDFCDAGCKKQLININSITTCAILTKYETDELIRKYRDYEDEE